MKRFFGVLVAVSIFSSQLQAQTTIGPSVIERPIYGQNIRVEFFTDLNILTDNTTIKIDATMRGDLSDLQKKFNAIVQTIQLPSNNCPSYGVHPLPKIEESSLEARGSVAVIKARLKATVWGCAKNPVPETVCEMRLRCHEIRAFGRLIARPCTHVPECRFRDGAPIKTVILEEGFWGEIPFSVATLDNRSVSIVPGKPDLRPRGDIGRWINDLARVFNSDLSTLADREIEKLVDEAALKAAIPPELQKYNLAVQGASLTGESGKLGVRIRLAGQAQASDLTKLLQELLDAQKK
jgi:hypothetical protein